MGRFYNSHAISRGALAFSLTVILLLSALAVAYFAEPLTSSRSSTTSAQKLRNVTVFGLASTVGPGTHLLSMSFADTKTGANFTAPVSDGKFSVSLPNGASYDVVARWAGNYSWQAGANDRGDLTVNMSGPTAAMSYNLQLETPPTIVAVRGTITWTLPSAYPISVTYTASDGESFQAAVQNSTFSTRLPNMMQYQVKVFWQYSDGTTDYLFGANQIINEAAGVVGLNLVIR